MAPHGSFLLEVTTPKEPRREEIRRYADRGRTPIAAGTHRRRQGAAQKLAHSRILLKADAAEGGPAWTDDRIAEALEVSGPTVERVRRRFVEEGTGAALARRPQRRPSRMPALDGWSEAQLIALACSGPTEGRKAWAMQLQADKLVELDYLKKAD